MTSIRNKATSAPAASHAVGATDTSTPSLAASIAPAKVPVCELETALAYKVERRASVSKLGWAAPLYGWYERQCSAAEASCSPRVQAATAAHQKGDYRLALQNSGEAMLSIPEYVPMHMLHADSWLESGAYSVAIAAYEQTLGCATITDSEKAEVLAKCAMSHWLLGHVEQAQICAEKSCALRKNDSAIAWLVIAHIRRLRGDSPSRIQQAQTSALVSHGFNAPMAHCLRGIMHYYSGSRVCAKEQFEAALQKQQALPIAGAYLDIMATRKGHQAASKVQSTDLLLAYSVDCALARAATYGPGAMQEGERWIRRALACEPQSAHAQYAAVDFYCKLQLPEFISMARTHLETMRPGTLPYFLAEATICIAEKDTAAASHSMTCAREAGLAYHAALCEQASIECLRGDLQKAEHTLGANGPDISFAELKMRAWVRLRLEYPVGAIVDLRKAIALCNSDPIVWRLLHAAYEALGDHADPEDIARLKQEAQEVDGSTIDGWSPTAETLFNSSFAPFFIGQSIYERAISSKLALEAVTCL